MEYKHTWTFSKDSIFLRFYLWLWDAKVSQVDFCKLFWGYAFFWVAIIARVISYPFRKIRDYGEPRGWWEDKPQQRKIVNEETPAKMGEFFAKPSTRKVAKVVGIILVVNIGTAALALLAWGIYKIGPPVYEYISSGNLFETIWNVISDQTFLFLLIFIPTWFASMACIAWFVKSDLGLRTWKFIKLSYYALKTNTCPKINVK